MEAVENYLAIEKIRFEEALEVEISVDEKANSIMLPCFLLNPLVENAIKHGFKTSGDVLKLQISVTLEDDGTLVIKIMNTGKLNSQINQNNAKIGLNNVKERLKRQLPEKSSFVLFEKNGFVIAQIKICR